MTIVYTSQTGHTRQYAQLLGQATGLPVLSLQQAKADLPANAPVIFLGWLMAGRINGLNRAAKLWHVRCAAGVGMAPASDQVRSNLQKANPLPAGPLFYLPGGWAPKQVNPIQRRAVNLVTRSTRKTLQAQADHSPQARAYLDMLTRGGSFVDAKHLAPMVQWWNDHV